MKRTISALLSFSLLASLCITSYAASDWYTPYIDDLMANGYTFWYEEEDFNPAEEVTREKLVTSLLRLQSNIIPEEYQVGGAGQDGLRLSSIYIAKDYGIIGENEYTFDNWYDPINRSEAAKLITRYISVFEKENIGLNTVNSSEVINDYDSYTDEEKAYIDGMIKYGIMVGSSDKCYHGDKLLSNAEFATVLYRMLHKEERLKVEAPDYSKQLSTFSTTTTRDKNRNFNVNKAAEAINGTIVNPGEEFSYYKTIGNPGKAAGYKESTIIVGGKYVPGYGGGVCQDATTLFNAALLSNMTITARRAHGLKATYVKPGYDATFASGSIDFKFVNPYDKPIKILANFDYETLTLTVSIMGAQTIEIPEVTLYTKGSGHTFTLYREVNGEVNYKTKSTYRD